LFNSGEDAKRPHTDERNKYLVETYGGGPALTYFEVPVVIDNLVGEIIKGR
jgi:hypothetical protein